MTNLCTSFDPAAPTSSWGFPPIPESTLASLQNPVPPQTTAAPTPAVIKKPPTLSRGFVPKAVPTQALVGAFVYPWIVCQSLLHRHPSSKSENL